MDSDGPYYQDQSRLNRSDLHEDVEISSSTIDQGDLTSHPPNYPDPARSTAPADVNNHLHDLIQAATNAAVQEQPPHGNSQPAAYQLDDLLESTQQYPSNDAINLSTPQVTPASEGFFTLEPRGARKRKLSSLNARQPISADRGTGMLITQEYKPSTSKHLTDARANGVHSAAALFRAPTDKKSTRPQMSKMFDSLGLSPEDFLRLQAAAKKYMLDPEHPERRDCVGNRGKTDTGQVRLELHKCVRDFLDGGAGAIFFSSQPQSQPAGEDAQDSETRPRDCFWPEDKEQIVKLCTPLLRRMVTNERQRQYALETRKSTKSPGETMPEVDRNVRENIASRGATPQQSQTPVIQMYVLDQEGKRPLSERLDLPLYDSIGWEYVKDVAKGRALAVLNLDENSEAASTPLLRLQVLMSTGLLEVQNSQAWQSAVEEVLSTVWLEKVVKVIVCPVDKSSSPSHTV